ncbi:hypothetical protein [Bifidobacterium eulemuris]|uniref:Uncharacterized protein n=1 Tax=Bifidobacterium eulemuris TaxID=1765219 RepID=A0A261GCH6_9BIFI|nr:hypothetical protein [Bifidobacterium eulemuris]OZG69149.1 hypothetical protein BEUL_0555 [Bifidobacterium eulemuris]QOL31336.1 hypothetical protein BE0216_01830 [Bifidobacterium eulemuris]
MPWWVWVLLVVFMLAMIAAGLVYAGLHGLRALRDAGEIGARLSQRFEAMGEGNEAQAPCDAPLFTQPLDAARERYVDAHADVIRRQEAKRRRHAERWAVWRRFND